MTTIDTALRRDTTVIGVVGAAHFFSHFFQLALPPLFPFLTVEFGVGYADLGLIPATFYLASGICQALVGVWVDRYGARPVLLAGLTLLAVATGLAGFATEFWMLLPLAALAGVGNSVFHPADLSILSTKVSPGRMGRAYSIHQLGGTLGYAASPVVILAMALAFGWHVAIVLAGLIGLGMVGLLVATGDLIATEPGARRATAQDGGDPVAAESTDRALALFEGFVTETDARITALRQLLSAHTAPAEALDWLASFLALTFDQRVAEPVRRSLLAEIATLWRQRGTVPGLTRLLSILA